MFASQCGSPPLAHLTAVPVLDLKLEMQKYLTP